MSRLMRPSLTFTQAIKSVLCQNYINFNGRARRSEYWFLESLNYLVLINYGFLNLLVLVSEKFFFINLIFLYLYFFFIITPEFAVAVRRLHDTGRSGFYLLLMYLNFLGLLILIYLLTQDSEPKTNIYGPSPKYGNDDNCSEIGLTKSVNISNKSNYVPSYLELCSRDYAYLIKSIHVDQSHHEVGQFFIDGATSLTPSQNNIVIQGNVVTPQSYNQGNTNYAGDINIVVPHKNINYTP